MKDVPAARSATWNRREYERARENEHNMYSAHAIA